MLKHFLISVKGKVQNVGFRYFVHKKALEHNIRGTVRNKPDGSVYIEASGDDPDMEAFLDHVRTGPKWSRIDNVTIQEAPGDNFNDFQITY